MILRTMFRSAATPLSLLSLLVLTTAAPLPLAHGAGPTTYEEVLRLVEEATASVKSWSADIETKMTMGGVEIKSRGETMGSGDRIMSDLAMEVMGQLMQVKSVLGADGIHWTETKAMGQIQVFKLDMNVLGGSNGDSPSTPGRPGAGQGAAQDPSKMFENLGQMYDMTLTGNEVMDGTDTYLLEGTIKDELKDRVDPSGNMANMGMSPNKIRVAVGVDDGFVRKFEQINTADVAFMSMTFTGIEINPSIDDSVFQYTAPQGANVIDGTEMITQGRGRH
ncbi:MAG: hypothetical protein IIB38_06555 [Candidatus Hydrogenedentes bacterium]|nr:hypothetical protein [Candidatus Hydrogenedentota bacterium]